VEITFHSYKDGSVRYTSLLGPKGEHLCNVGTEIEMAELQTEMIAICTTHGGTIHRDLNKAFGDFVYLNGPSPDVYAQCLAKWKAKHG
jgi:hypothetical protein